MSTVTLKLPPAFACAGALMVTDTGVAALIDVAVMNCAIKMLTVTVINDTINNMEADIFLI